MNRLWVRTALSPSVSRRIKQFYLSLKKSHHRIIIPMFSPRIINRAYGALRCVTNLH